MSETGGKVNIKNCETSINFTNIYLKITYNYYIINKRQYQL